MRTVLLMVSFGILALATAAGQPQVTCDGRSKLSVQCDAGLVPTGYYESQVCEGDLQGLGVCKNAIAFNVDYFACSDPQTDPSTNPPEYRTYCCDTNYIVECTVKRTCAGTTITPPVGPQFTRCFQFGEPETTSRYKKTHLTPSTNPACTPTVSIPIGP